MVEYKRKMRGRCEEGWLKVEGVCEERVVRRIQKRGSYHQGGEGRARGRSQGDWRTRDQIIMLKSFDAGIIRVGIIDSCFPKVERVDRMNSVETVRLVDTYRISGLIYDGELYPSGFWKEILSA